MSSRPAVVLLGMDIDSDHPRPWLGLGLLGLPTIVLSIDLSVLHLALPTLSAELGADSIDQLWIVDIYAFMIAGLLLTMGALGDMVGRRRLLLVGAAAFAMSSLLAACATSPEMLIVARALMGMAGATLMPSTLAIIGELFPDPTEHGTAIGVWVACFMGGIALGPLVGGVLLSAFWWGSVFLLALPVMAVLLLLGPRVLPTGASRGPTTSIDVISVALSLLALLPATYGVKELARDGLQLDVAVAFAVGLAAGALFVRRQRRLAHPLVDLELLRSRAVSGALAISLIGTAVAGGAILVLNLYLQTVLQLSPLRAGLIMLPSGVALIVGAVSASGLAARTRPELVLAGGFALSAVGFAILATASPEQGVVPLLVGATLTGAGSGPQAALLTQIVMTASPPAKAGSAAALSETSGELGMALGVALLGALATMVYRAEIASGGVSARAGEGIVAALEEGRRRGSAGVLMVRDAQDAFLTSMNVVAAAAAVMCCLLAFGAARLARGGGSAEPAHEPGLVRDGPEGT